MILKSIKNRYSCRKYASTPVEKSKLKNILEAAILAPSANNMQPWKLVVISEQAKLQELKKVCKQEFPSTAPLTIAVCCNNTDKLMTCGHAKFLSDGFSITVHILLQAAHEGLGSCWLGAFYQDKAAKLVNLPKDYSVVSLIPIGYAADKLGPKIRKKLYEVVINNEFK